MSKGDEFSGGLGVEMDHLDGLYQQHLEACERLGETPVLWSDFERFNQEVVPPTEALFNALNNSGIDTLRAGKFSLVVATVISKVKGIPKPKPFEGL